MKANPKSIHSIPQRGFTLVELVAIVIIVAVLAAVAVPRFLNLGTDARVASLKTFQGVLQTTAINVHVLCMADPVCADTSVYFAGNLHGQFAAMYKGWFDAGDSINSGEIDSWVNYSGFTVVFQEPYHRFMLDGAPDPSNCWLQYTQTYTVGVDPTFNMATSGC